MADEDDLATRPRLVGEIGLEFDGVAMTLEIEMPDGPVSLDDLIPLMHSLATTVAVSAERRVEAAGRTISCRAGCGACCRQSVPITEGEARYLAAHVAAMPEPRRAQVVARFEAANRSLMDSDAGRRMLEATRTGAPMTRADIHDYFGLGIACPFLEDESCSIHPVRPMVCREYVVLSDPVHCAALDGEHIERVRMTRILDRVAMVGKRDTPRGWILLVQALEFAAACPPPPRDRHGPDILYEVIMSQPPKNAAPAIEPIGREDDIPAPPPPQQSRS